MGRGYVRIIAGKYRGYRLPVAEAEGLRPTADRVREAWFSALDARGLLQGARVVDLFAGTGALGLEALSRGASQAVFVDRNAELLRAIDDHAKQLGCAARTCRADLLKAPQEAWTQLCARLDDAPTLVLCDPPYAIAHELGPLIEAAGAAPLHLMIEIPVPTTLVLPESFNALKTYHFRGRELWLAERPPSP